MSDDPVLELARRINGTDRPRAVLYLAGGGSEVFPMLLARGGSTTPLAGRILNTQDDFRAVLGFETGRLVDARVARGLAMAAFRHSLDARGDLAPEEVFGIGSTSKLATGRGEREGRDHEIHVAVQAAHFTDCWSITLPRGHDRAREERINALFLLNVVATLKVGSKPIPLEYEGLEVPSGAVGYRGDSGEASMADLLVGRRAWVALDSPPRTICPGPVGLAGQGRGSLPLVARTSEDQGPPRLLLPGSFRPLHDGHVAMAEAASRRMGLPCGFEISLFHPEKPPLDYITLRSRLGRFEGRGYRLYLTNAPTYVEKARLFPGCTFVVGHDTALRIVDPRYYGGPTARDAMLDELERLGTRFLVFGRVDASGEFRDFSPEEFEHPVAGFLARVAIPVPSHVFRLDISSTEIRRRLGDEFP